MEVVIAREVVRIACTVVYSDWRGGGRLVGCGARSEDSEIDSLGLDLKLLRAKTSKARPFRF